MSLFAISTCLLCKVGIFHQSIQFTCALCISSFWTHRMPIFAIVFIGFVICNPYGKQRFTLIFERYCFWWLSSSIVLPFHFCVMLIYWGISNFKWFFCINFQWEIFWPIFSSVFSSYNEPNFFLKLTLFRGFFSEPAISYLFFLFSIVFWRSSSLLDIDEGCFDYGLEDDALLPFLAVYWKQNSIVPTTIIILIES